MTETTNKPEGPPPPRLDMDEPTQVRRRLADNLPTTFAGRLGENLYYMRGRGALEIGIIFTALLVLYALLGVRGGFPFFTQNNLSGVITQNVPVLALLAIGVGMLMIAGEFDLSIGFAIAFSGIVFIKVANDYGWIVGVVAALVASVGAALINGLITVYTNIPSFIATLGMGFVWKGASILVNGVSPAILVPEAQTDTFENIFTGDFGFFQSPLLWMVGVGIVTWFLLHRHQFGNKVYAVGGNASAAKAVSIKPKVVKLQAFALMGVMVGLSAVLIAARTTTMQPTGTEAYTLVAVAAAVVGGCSLTGGRGTILGMIIGAAMIRCIDNGLVLGHAPGYYRESFLGVAIVAAAIFNRFMEGKAT